MKLYIGCCGFGMARARYHSTFNVVELQETFYDAPDISRLRRYREEAPQGFVFTLKAWQAITHPLDSPTWRRAKFVPNRSLGDRYGLLRPTKEVFEAWEKIVEAARVLNARAVVVQTPPSFGYTDENHRNAIEFFSAVDSSGFTIGWEPRGTWVQNLDKVADVVSRFKSVVHVVDPLKLLPAVDKPIAYFRLHGLGPGEVNYGYRYTDEDLDRLCRVVLNLCTKSSETYVMFNNVSMTQDALRFLRTCRASC